MSLTKTNQNEHPPRSRSFEEKQNVCLSSLTKTNQNEHPPRSRSVEEKCTVCSVQCAVCSLKCTVYSVHYYPFQYWSAQVAQVRGPLRNMGGGVGEFDGQSAMVYFGNEFSLFTRANACADGGDRCV
jgi:hypothetical protein